MIIETVLSHIKLDIGRDIDYKLNNHLYARQLKTNYLKIHIKTIKKDPNTIYRIIVSLIA